LRLAETSAPPTRSDSSQRVGQSVAVIGLGNIGLFTAQLVARMPEVSRVVLVDKDVTAWKNRIGQDFTARESRAAAPKVFLARRRLHAIRPDLDIVALHGAVEDVPRGLLQTDLLLACLDSKRARMAVNEIAWRLGVPWLDAGVQADGLLARLNVYVPGPDVPCLECAWDDRSYAQVEQVVPCQGAAPVVPPTNAPACLGSLAASLQALTAGHVLTGQLDRLATGRQMVLDARARRCYDAALRHNPACRFDHQTWAITPLRASARELTVAEALRLGRRGRRVDPQAALAAEPMSFVRALACPCGGRRELLRLSGRLPARLAACPQCGRPMQPFAFGTFSQLSAQEFTAAELRRPLAQLGFRPGDVFSVIHADKRFHAQLPLA
jgi:adenylyltransferase/sulfurtransferase